MRGLPTITLWQPWASLIVPARVKWIETRSWAAPEKLIGQRIGIHAAKKWSPTVIDPDGDTPWSCADRGFAHPVIDHWSVAEQRFVTYALPLGVLLGTARLTACVPMVESIGRPGDGTEELPDALLLSGLNGHMWLSPEAADVEDQRPFGDFAPGRFAWLLDDPVPTTERCPWCDGHGATHPTGWDGLRECRTCEGKGWCQPIPATGRQRIWHWTPD